MKFKGKLLGSLAGLIFAGPIGLALGFIAGHLHDLGYFHALIQATQKSAYTYSQQVFFNNTFKIMGYIAKSDGRVSENEIKAAKRIMSKMGLNETQKQMAIELFSIGKQATFNPNIALSELQHACKMQPVLLQLFLEIQLEIAQADGHLTPAKQKTLDQICMKLGITGFHHQQQYQNHYEQKQDYTQQNNAYATGLTGAYNTLGISPDTKKDDIKKAYRRLMNQNHPDKLTAKGLPPEMIKMATQKTQRIKEAYEAIKAAKGF